MGFTRTLKGQDQSYNHTIPYSIEITLIFINFKISKTNLKLRSIVVRRQPESKNQTKK